MARDVTATKNPWSRTHFQMSLTVGLALRHLGQALSKRFLFQRSRCRLTVPVTPGEPVPRRYTQAMNRFRVLDSGVEWRAGAEFVRVEEWGPGRVRVRAGVGRLLADLPGALAEARPATGPTSCSVTLPQQPTAGDELDGTTGYQAAAGTAALVSTGDLRVEISPAGMIRFC